MNEISAKTRNMQVVFRSINEWFQAGKVYGPSYRDIVELSGLPIGTVYKTCQFLKQDQKIVFDNKIARSIRLWKEEE